MNDSDDTAFDLNSWMAEDSATDPSQQPLPGGYVRQRTQDIGTDPDAVITAMRSAAEGSDPERVITLGRAALGMVSEIERQPIRELMDQAAIRLVNRYIPRRLETAHVWASSWAAFSINPRAKEYERDLRERVNQVKQREATIAAHIAGGNLAALAGALRELGRDGDRCQGTDEVIRQGEQALQRRGEQLQRAKAELAQVVPGNLDRAVEVMTLIYNEEPDRANQEHLTALNTRLHQARQRLEVARQALQRRLLPDVGRGLALMRESADRTVGSTECLAQLQSLHADLVATRNERLDDYTAFLKQRDLTKAIRALQDIRDIDPQHPELAKIADLKKRQKRLVQLHARLQEAMDAYDEAEIRQLRPALAREKLQLSASGALLQQADDTLAQIDARRRRQRRSTILAITIVLTLIAIPAAWYQWETQAFSAAMAPVHSDDERQQALQAYLDDPYHTLYRQQAQGALHDIAMKAIDERWQAVVDEEDLQQRIALAAAFVADYQEQAASDPAIALRIDEAEALQATAREARDREAFHRALHTEGSYELRIAALHAYRQRPEARHGVQAQAAIERLRQQEDSEAWASANANGDLADRIAGLENYLASDGQRQHRQEAERSLADLRLRQQQLDQRNSDAEAWQAVTAIEDPADRLAAVMTYLERPEPRRHQVEAQHLRQRLEKELDDARFQQAITITDPLERHRALERFLTDHPDSPHRSDAEHARAAALRAYDDQRYATAIGPGIPEERLRRLQSYLQSTHQRYHDEDVRTEITAVSKAIDFAALSRARSQPDPLVRLLALDAYRARDGALPEHRRLADKAGEQALQQIATFPPADIAPLPGEVLDRLPTSVLAGLPLASLTRLSTATLLRLPTESFARFGDQELSRLPRRVRRRVAYHPGWAAASGVDAAGPWADLRIDDDLHLRFRRLVAGSLAENAEDATDLQQDTWLSESELAQVVWELILGRRHNPSATKGPRLPVHGVGPDQLDEALERLRRRVRRAPGSEALRLPRLRELRLAAYVDRTEAPTIPDTTDDPLDQVGSDPQAWQGFHHLLGNVSEWCRDGDSLVLFGGPFPARIDGDVLQTDNAQARAGLRLAIPAGANEARQTAAR